MTSQIGISEETEFPSFVGLDPSGDCGTAVSYELRNEAGTSAVNPTYLTLTSGSPNNKLTMFSNDRADETTYKHTVRAYLTNCPLV
jgi:hypothetical protein